MDIGIYAIYGTVHVDIIVPRSCDSVLCRYDYSNDVGNFTENKLQIIANLANFGYDPINYGFFRTLNVLDLFLDVLAEEEQDGSRTGDGSDFNDTMRQFAIGGICNCCLGLLHKGMGLIHVSSFADRLNKAYIIENDGIHYAVNCLERYTHSLAHVITK